MMDTTPSNLVLFTILLGILFNLLASYLILEPTMIPDTIVTVLSPNVMVSLLLLKLLLLFSILTHVLFLRKLKISFPGVSLTEVFNVLETM